MKKDHPTDTSDNTQTNSEIKTMERFFNGKIIVKQSPSGYRFSIDAVLLAGFVNPKPGDQILDAGTGCGIIPLILTYKCPDLRITGIEIQKDLADIALENVRTNKMEDRIRIICQDIKQVSIDQNQEPFDLMVSNPPYRQINSGKINPNPQKAGARHEIYAALPDILGAAKRLLKLSGRLAMIYPVKRTVDLIHNMREFGIEPKKIQLIHSYENTPAKLMLMEGIKGGGPEVEVTAPLYIYNKDGSYTEEVQKLMTGA